MLASGAKRVWWLQTREESLTDAARAALQQIRAGTPVIAESNRLRLALQPGVFLMVHSDTEAVKPSAQRVMHLADQLVSEPAKWPVDALVFEEGRWGLREPATAIVMAGGASRRMGRDKRWIRIGERPMIEYVIEQLRPHFEEVLISAAASAGLEHLGQRIIIDRGAGAGPLLGLACALQESRHELNFVVACDVPDVPLPLARRMVRECAGFDAVVPRSRGGHLEPLLAVYRSTAAAAMRRHLRKGNYKITDTLDRLRVRYIDLPADGAPVNLNTAEDYEHYIRSHHDTT